MFRLVDSQDLVILHSARVGQIRGGVKKQCWRAGTPHPVATSGLLPERELRFWR